TSEADGRVPPRLPSPGARVGARSSGPGPCAHAAGTGGDGSEPHPATRAAAASATANRPGVPRLRAPIRCKSCALLHHPESHVLIVPRGMDSSRIGAKDEASGPGASFHRAGTLEQGGADPLLHALRGAV